MSLLKDSSTHYKPLWKSYERRTDFTTRAEQLIRLPSNYLSITLSQAHSFHTFLCHSPVASLSGLSTSVFWKRACTFHHKCCLSLKKDSNKHVWIIMRVFAAGHGHRWRVFHLRCSCGFFDACLVEQYSTVLWLLRHRQVIIKCRYYRMPNIPYSSYLTFDQLFWLCIT